MADVQQDGIDEGLKAEGERDAMQREAKVIVVMPARNAARTLERTVNGIPREVVDEIILVDDKSTDNTVELARELPIHLIWHPHNVGYGGNQKTCYLQALQRDAEIVVMLHPDGQYEPSLIPRLIQPILDGEADMVLGSRLAEPGMAREGGDAALQVRGEQGAHHDRESHSRH